MLFKNDSLSFFHKKRYESQEWFKFEAKTRRLKKENRNKLFLKLL